MEYPDRLIAAAQRGPSPAYQVDLAALRRNLAVLDEVQQESGATVLLALKAFAAFGLFPLIRRHLSGICASGLHEARLGREHFGGEVHTFCPAFKPEEFPEVLSHSDHVVFNSFAQWKRFRGQIKEQPHPPSVGLRVNPEVSTGSVPLYDPCQPDSRLGIRRREFDGQSLDGIEGLHFHTLCEQNVDALEKTLQGFEERFGDFFPRLRWVNFGGGHHITRPDYDRPRLIELIRDFRRRTGLAVYLEPGEAVVLNTGYLVTEVLDLLPRSPRIALLDTSATAHMPDVLEMPYRPEILNAGGPGQFAHDYLLGGLTCLAGDVIGTWSFPQPLQIGDRILFTDMAHYTFVKNTTFNGVPLPALTTYDPQTDKVQILREFGYTAYRDRLG